MYPPISVEDFGQLFFNLILSAQIHAVCDCSCEYLGSFCRFWAKQQSLLFEKWCRSFDRSLRGDECIYQKYENSSVFREKDFPNSSLLLVILHYARPQVFSDVLDHNFSISVSNYKDIRKTRAFHFLSRILQDSSFLVAISADFIASLLSSSLRGLASTNWDRQNAAIRLFSNVFQVSIRSGDGTLTLLHFFEKFPSLLVEFNSILQQVGE